MLDPGWRYHMTPPGPHERLPGWAYLLYAILIGIAVFLVLKGGL